MFLGVKENSLDDKNRCIVPAQFRPTLGIECVLVKDPDNCLILYTLADWKAYAEERIKSRPDEDDNARQYKDYFFMNSEPCRLDKSGRIIMPQKYLDHAGIVKEMVNVGQIDCIKIWSKERYDEMEKELEPKGRDLRSDMNKYNSKA